MIQAFVFDLDGVIRHWDPEIVLNAERTHGLPTGALLGIAFQHDLLVAAVTGELTDDEWRREVASRLQEKYPEGNGSAAVADWSLPPGEIIAGSLDVLAQARKQGLVCMLTNATSRLQTDLAALGISDYFDHIFNSSAIGFAKPDARIYQHVEEALGLDPGQILYIDDSATNIESATQRGWTSLLATQETPLAQLLADVMPKPDADRWRA